MDFVVDIGNSNIVIAIHDGMHWIQKFRFETKDQQPTYYYEVGLRDLLLEWGIAPSSIKLATISSVVPHVTEHIVNAIKINFGVDPIVLSPDVFVKLDMHIPKVHEIGSDLVANAFAIKSKSNKNTIIVDFGTALTFTVYSPIDGIVGVTIAPGLKTIISTLSSNTAQLPHVDIEMPNSAIGKSTNTAIQAGVLFGYIGLVKELLKRIKSELNDNYQVVATGGLSSALGELKEEFDAIDKNLTLDGVKLLGVVARK
ncbi:MAG: type III pantothenate kinase [Saprospiraceae bacterium]